MIKLLLPLIIFIPIACNQPVLKNPEVAFEKYPQLNSVDSFNVQLIKQFENYLYLPDIQNGSDSLEIRIYTFYAFDPGYHLFIIKASADSLIKKHYYFTPRLLHKPDGTASTYDSQFCFMHDFYFTKGDSIFIKLFKAARLDTLPTQHLIPNLKGGCTDGAGFEIEISTKTNYRLLTYFNPRCYPGSSQNQSFDDFIQNFFSLLPQDELNWFYNSKKQNKLQY